MCDYEAIFYDMQISEAWEEPRHCDRCEAWEVCNECEQCGQTICGNCEETLWNMRFCPDCAEPCHEMYDKLETLAGQLDADDPLLEKVREALDDADGRAANPEYESLLTQAA